MITVSEAKNLITKSCINFKIEALGLIEALGCVAAENLIAPSDTPPFNQSAMDGYAFSFSQWDKVNSLKIVGEVQAGKTFKEKINPQETIRISTGAPIPENVDTVVMQEKVERLDGFIKINTTQVNTNDNIRFKGSQTRKGELALVENQMITPATISYLAGMGFQKIRVYTKPKLGIVVTGKELVSQGKELKEGQIFESNGIGLHAALKQINIEPEDIRIVDDREPELIAAIKEMMHCDLLILTGGVSEGDYDLVPAALDKSGVTKIFHNIKQKPGKPVYFGTYPKGIVFALPGNPAAVMSCYYQYVQLAIEILMKKSFSEKNKIPLKTSYTKKAGFTHFLKGKITSDGVEILGSQRSYMLNSFALADCLVELEEEKEFFEKGALVEVVKIT